MLVFCGRRHGLFANLTRFLYFRKPTPQEQLVKFAVAQIENEIWQNSRPGASLREVFKTIIGAYSKAGFPNEHIRHHQGGITGYRAREERATPTNQTILKEGFALAWNPTLPGGKIEDTIVCSKDTSPTVLTQDINWPTFQVDEMIRPDFLVKLN